MNKPAMQIFTTFISYVTGEIETKGSCKLTQVHSTMVYGLGLIACQSIAFLKTVSEQEPPYLEGMPQHLKDYLNSQQEVVEEIADLYTSAIEKMMADPESLLKKVAESYPTKLTAEGHRLVQELINDTTLPSNKKLGKLADIVELHGIEDTTDESIPDTFRVANTTKFTH